MALEMYRDDAMLNSLDQVEKFSGLGDYFFTLTNTDVESVYLYSTEYTKIVGYSIAGNELTIPTPLLADEHIIVMPTNNLDVVFTGIEGSTRVQTKKVVFHKTGAFIYDDLKLYSENFTELPYEYKEIISGDGFISVSLDGLGLYDKNGVPISDANAVGIVLVSGTITPDITYGYTTVVLVINGVCVGNVCANSATVIALPLGTTIPTPNYTTDIVEILSTSNMSFAIDVNGTLPADEAFKPLIIVPTLTTAAPTQRIWLRESAVIPTVTSESPGVTFKLTGQEYPE